MFQLTIHHNEEECFERIGEAVARLNRHGLEVIQNTYDPKWDEYTIVVRGTQEQFIAWNDECSEGGPSINVEEFLAELNPV